jgi:transcriptional regulator with XRE-family HTH domain
MEEKIRKRLIKAIEEYPKSQAILSEELEFSRNTLTNWKKKLPDQVNDFFKVAQKLGIRIDDITINEVENNGKYKDIEELFEQLTEEELFTMKYMIKKEYKEIIDQRVTSSVSKDTG